MENPTDDDVWHVLLPSGDVCMMTLDLLDDAFQDGLIHEGSLLWKEGNAEWMTLAEVAGLNDEPEPPASYGQTSYAEDSPPYSMGPLSTAPVAADIGDMEFELEAMSLRPRKRSSLRWMAAAVLVGAAALGFAKRGAVVSALHLPAKGSIAVSNAAGAMMATPSPVPTVPAAAVTPAATAPAPASEVRLSDETKRALEEADKKLATKLQQKQQQLQSHSVDRVDRPKAKLKSDNPFHKGGNQHDPLNASL
jgi:hypothetical protein